MDIEALRESMKKKHYLFPVRRETLPGKFHDYVLFVSRGMNTSRNQKIYIEVENEDTANNVIKQLAATIEITEDKCIIGAPRVERRRTPLKSRPRKIEAGFYEYRRYEILDLDSNGDTFLGPPSNIGLWEAREKPWPDGKRFGSFNTLQSAMLSIDEHLASQDKNKAAPK